MSQHTSEGRTRRAVRTCSGVPLPLRGFCSLPRTLPPERRIRLVWGAPEAELQSPASRGYVVWRRTDREAPFEEIGRTNLGTSTFLDAASPGGDAEYEITVVW